MMCLTEHPATRGETYLQHATFALGVAARLAVAACIFLIHGLLPCVSVPKRFNLTAMSRFLAARNEYREK